MKNKFKKNPKKNLNSDVDMPDENASHHEKWERRQDKNWKKQIQESFDDQD
jgi:hypothetical protein